MEENNLPELYSIFLGEVCSLQPYGVFIKIPGYKKNGLVHKSQMSNGKVDDPADVLDQGEQVFCKVISIDPEGDKIALSMKVVNQASGKDLDPNQLQTSQDELRRKSGQGRGKSKIELGAILDTVCKKCGGRGHFTNDCFHTPGGKTYDLVPEQDDLSEETSKDAERVQKIKKKKKKSEKKLKKKKKHRKKHKKRETSSSSSERDDSDSSSDDQRSKRSADHDSKQQHKRQRKHSSCQDDKPRHSSGHDDKPRHTGSHDDKPRHSGGHDDKPRHSGSHDDKHRHSSSHDDKPRHSGSHEETRRKDRGQRSHRADSDDYRHGSRDDRSSRKPYRDRHTSDDRRMDRS